MTTAGVCKRELSVGQVHVVEHLSGVMVTTTVLTTLTKLNATLAAYQLPRQLVRLCLEFEVSPVKVFSPEPVTLNVISSIITGVDKFGYLCR